MCAASASIFACCSVAATRKSCGLNLYYCVLEAPGCLPSCRRLHPQAQVIYLAQEPHIGCGAQLGENTIAVHLRDDLCGRARVGDQLLVVGTGQHIVALDSTSALWGCRPTLQVSSDGVGLVLGFFTRRPAPC